MSRSRLDLHQALLPNSFRKRRELQFFSTCNAYSVLSRDFTHQNAQMRLLFNSAILLKKQVVIRKI